MRAQCLGLTCGIALLVSTTAQAAPPMGCVTPDEIRGFVAFALPDVVDRTVKKCSNSLRTNGYFNSRGSELVQRLAVGKEAGWPMASLAFRKMGGEFKGKATASLSDRTVRALVEDEMIPKLIADIPANMCRNIEAIVETLDPLPAANMVQFVTSIFVVAGRDGSKLTACPSEQAAQ